MTDKQSAINYFENELKRIHHSTFTDDLATTIRVSEKVSACETALIKPKKA